MISIKNKYLINILVNILYDIIFLKSVDASDKFKDANYFFDILNWVIEEIGEHLVVEVIINNVSVYHVADKKLWRRRSISLLYIICNT